MVVRQWTTVFLLSCVVFLLWNSLVTEYEYSTQNNSYELLLSLRGDVDGEHTAPREPNPRSDSITGTLPTPKPEAKYDRVGVNAFAILRERQRVAASDLTLDSGLNFNIADPETHEYPVSIGKEAYKECFESGVEWTSGTGWAPRMCPSDAKALSEGPKPLTLSLSSCHPERFRPTAGFSKTVPDKWPDCPGKFKPSGVNLRVGSPYTSDDFAKLGMLLRNEHVDPSSIGSPSTKTNITVECPFNGLKVIIGRDGEEIPYENGVSIDLPTVLLPKDIYDKASDVVKNLPYMKIKSSSTGSHKEAMQNLQVFCESKGAVVMAEYTMVLYEPIRKAAEITRSWTERGYEVPPNLQEDIGKFDTRKDVREHVLESVFEKKVQDAEPAKSGGSQQPYNMLFLMLDGVSRGNFYRAMPKTLQYFQDSLKNEKSPFRLYDFEKNNVVGQNSIPNQNPMMSGVGEDKLPYASVIKDVNSWNKQVPWVFDWLEAMGYVTAFAEQLYVDRPAHMDFTSIRRYFWKDLYEPTDYVNDVHAKTTWGYSNVVENQRCTGGRRIMELTSECVVSFFLAHHRLADTPTFMYVHTFEGHDASETAQNSADLDTKVLLETMADSGLLSNTIVILNADHGLHYGPMMSRKWAVEEQKNPVFFMLVPTQLVQGDSELDRNLATNQRRLFSPFDIYATLLHLPFLHSSKAHAPPATHETGISLFTELPADRSCTSAGIPVSYCQCIPLVDVDLEKLKAEPDKVFEHVTYKQIFDVGGQAAEFINKIVAASSDGPKKCAKIEFKEVQVVRTALIQPSDIVAAQDMRKGGTELSMTFMATSDIDAGAVEHQWQTHAFLPASGDKTPRVRFVHRISPYTIDKKTCGDVNNMEYEQCVCKAVPISS